MKILFLFLLICLGSCQLFPAFRAPRITRADVPDTVYTSRLYVTVEGTDPGIITGWLITAENIKPDPGGPGWFSEKPYYDLPAKGTYTLFVWAKDDDERVSKSRAVIAEYVDPVVRDWTFMVWLNADNSLEMAAMEDFNEMEYGLFLAGENDALLGDKLAVVLQVDRILYYDAASHDDGSDWTGTRRYLLKPDPDSFDQEIYAQLLLDQGEVNMGDAGELADFIDYTKTNFPAEHYALILWNHGAGVRSNRGSSPLPRLISIDNSNNTDGLYTAEITDHLNQAHSVDLLGIDACYTGLVEVGYQYRPGSGGFEANYFVAAPGEEQGDGWDYTRLLARLSAGGGAENIDPAELIPARLAETIVASYRDFITGFSFHTGETMTALDLNQIQPVKTALDGLAATLTEDKPIVDLIQGSGVAPITMEYFQEMETEGNDEGDIDIDNDYEWTYFPHFDLYDFAQRLNREGSLSAASRNAASALMTAVDNCVLASYAGKDFNKKTYASGDPVDGVHGMGFFFPDGDQYYEAALMKHYQLQWFYTHYDTNSWRPPLDGKPFLYGKLDFCNSDLDGSVETWRELLEYYYDAGGDINLDTPGNY